MPTALQESQPLTTRGTILGTFQYMAPEQLEGGEADARSDIFALRLRALRDADGPEGVHGQEPGEPDRLDHELRPAADLVDPADDPAGARPDRQGLSREGARAALEHGARRDAAAAVDRGGRLDGGACRRPSSRGARAARSWRGPSRPRPCSPPPGSPTASCAARRSRRRSCASRSRAPPEVTTIDVPAHLSRREDPGVRRDRHGRQGPDLGAAAERARRRSPCPARRAAFARSGRPTAGSSASWPTACMKKVDVTGGPPTKICDARRRLGRQLEPGRRDPLRRHGQRIRSIASRRRGATRRSP